jgi:hypothetical protein
MQTNRRTDLHGAIRWVREPDRAVPAGDSHIVGAVEAAAVPVVEQRLRVPSGRTDRHQRAPDAWHHGAHTAKPDAAANAPEVAGLTAGPAAASQRSIFQEGSGTKLAEHKLTMRTIRLCTPLARLESWCPSRVLVSI